VYFPFGLLAVVDQDIFRVEALVKRSCISKLGLHGMFKGTVAMTRSLIGNAASGRDRQSTRRLAENNKQSFRKPQRLGGVMQL
jgi:hypothetical protein